MSIDATPVADPRTPTEKKKLDDAVTENVCQSAVTDETEVVSADPIRKYTDCEEPVLDFMSIFAVDAPELNPRISCCNIAKSFEEIPAVDA